MNINEWVPEERDRTIRQSILSCLQRDRLSAAELSRLVSKPEKDIYHHLDEMIKAGRVRALPPLCAACNYSFDDRRKTKKPGKCPKCKSTRIKPPLFTSS